jgi:cyclohexanecarboxylate-CoA ligase
MRLVIEPTTRRLQGELSVPDSKYHAHRALILASLAEGESRILGLTHARHVRYTIALLRALGTKIATDGDSFVVRGGPYHPSTPNLSVGSSGTTLYFMVGLAGLSDSPVTIVGQRYFQRRPIGPLLSALRQIGVRLTAKNGCLPITVQPAPPEGGDAHIPGTLSQWISGLLLLAPFARKRTTIHVDGELNEKPYVDLTIRMMRQFGLLVDVAEDWRTFTVEPNQRARATTVTLPPDVSSAAFGLAVCAFHPSDVVFRGLVCLDEARREHPEGEFLDVVRAMGLPMDYDASQKAVRVRHAGIRLRSVTADCRHMPDMFPILCAMGTFASGTTVLRNIAHVRLKESDRVAAMMQLGAVGGELRVEGDTLLVTGVEHIRGGEFSSHNDHRVLMSLAVAATRADGRTLLTYPNAYRISYPTFLEQMNGVGNCMGIEDDARLSRREVLLAR